MKNILNLTTSLCLLTILIFTSCTKETITTDQTIANSPQELTAFLETNPNIDEIEHYFISLPNEVSFYKGSTITSEELTDEQRAALALDASTVQITNRACDDVVSQIVYAGGPSSVFIANDPTSNNDNAYIAILYRNGSILSATADTNTNSIFSSLVIPDCGNYETRLFVREIECGTNWKLINSASKNYPDCW